MRELLDRAVHEDLDRWQGQDYPDAWMVHNYKTMLVTAGLAASSNPISVWVGATLGAAAAAALGALLGRFSSKVFSAKVTRYIAAALFTHFGLGLIISAFLP